MRIIARVKTDLSAGRVVADSQFDSVLPAEFYDLSAVHWTPLAVVRTLLDWVRPAAGTRILDVGSGCGKFCVAVALSRPVHCTGVELRPALVEAAIELAGQYGAGNTQFMCDDMAKLDWTGFDLIYLYNPFHENILNPGPGEPALIDSTIPLSRDRFEHYIGAVIAKLATCRSRTRLATYNGFGAAMPPGWFRKRAMIMDGRALELWEKA